MISENRLYHLGLHLVYFPFSVFVACAVFFYFDHPLEWIVWIPILFYQTPFLYLVIRKRSDLVFHLLAFLAVMAITLLFAGNFYDFSWDGVYYHQVGILRLAQGWNPFTLVANPKEVFGDQWWLLVNMTKLTWFYQAACYLLLDQIEYAKHLNLMLLIAAFCVLYSTLVSVTRVPKKWAALFGALITLNPIATSQLLTFYVDGCLASLMAIMAALAVRYFHRPRLITLVWVGMSFIMIMNVKLTGIVYAGAFGAGFVVFEIASRGFRLAQKWAIALALSVVCGIVLGFSPYITNYLQNHDIVRPLREAREQKNHDPYKLQRPENMTKLSRLERLAASIFSRSNASGPPLRYEYKIPFLVSRDELESIKVLDCRVGGFGPWFGGALILSLLVLGWRLYLRDAQAHWLMLPMGLVLATVLLNPESWWARFVPQTWILPLIPLWVTGTFKGPIALRRLRQGALFVFAVNAVGVAALSLGYQVENARQVEYSMDRLLLLPGPLGVDFGPWDAAKHRFEARGIPFVDLTHSKSRRCQPMVRVGSAELKICPNGIY